MWKTFTKNRFTCVNTRFRDVVEVGGGLYANCAIDKIGSEYDWDSK